MIGRYPGNGQIESGLRKIGISVTLLLIVCHSTSLSAGSPEPARPSVSRTMALSSSLPSAPMTGAAVGLRTAAAPVAVPSAAKKQPPQGGRLVMGVASWGVENPFAWHQQTGDKRLWDHMYDTLIDRDPETAEKRPGLAEWKPSKDHKTWTFKLRQGVQFHDGWGELTSEDVKFTLEQHLKPGATGAGVFWVKQVIERIETPDKYTLVLYLKYPTWDVPLQFSRGLGYMTISSKRYLQSLGEEKARLHPVGSGPFRYVEGRQGDYHRFEAIPNHWLQTAGFRELLIRLIPEQSVAVSALRAGEVDIIPVTGDFLKQAKQEGFRIHEIAGGLQYWIALPGQTFPDKRDYCPTCPWVGDPKDPKSQENARKVRMALNLAVNKRAIVDKLWSGHGSLDPFGLYYYPNQPGFSKEWKIPPYDPQGAKQLLAEAGYPKGFEITLALRGHMGDAPDVGEAVALDWERIGIKVKRHEEPWSTLLPKVRRRNTGGVAVFQTGRFSDEPVILLDRTTSSWGAFNFAAETPEYDQMIKVLLKEFDPAQRAQLHRQLAQKMYDDVRVVMIGWKSNTFAISKRIARWRTVYGAPSENNLDYITWSGQ